MTGIILRPDGSGTYGGSYDILGPTGNSLGYPTVAAKAGDLVELFGVGFGPTSPKLPAGMAFSGAIPTSNTARLIIDNSTAIVVDPSFCGLSSAGLYQINFRVRQTLPPANSRFKQQSETPRPNPALSSIFSSVCVIELIGASRKSPDPVQHQRNHLLGMLSHHFSTEGPRVSRP